MWAPWLADDLWGQTVKLSVVCGSHRPYTSWHMPSANQGVARCMLGVTRGVGELRLVPPGCVRLVLPGSELEYTWCYRGIKEEYAWCHQGVKWEYAWCNQGVKWEYAWCNQGVKWEYAW